METEGEYEERGERGDGVTEGTKGLTMNKGRKRIRQEERKRHFNQMFLHAFPRFLSFHYLNHAFT